MFYYTTSYVDLQEKKGDVKIIFTSPQAVGKLSRTRKSINIFDKAQILKVKKIKRL